MYVSMVYCIVFLCSGWTNHGTAKRVSYFIRNNIILNSTNNRIIGIPIFSSNSVVPFHFITTPVNSFSLHYSMFLCHLKLGQSSQEDSQATSQYGHQKEGIKTKLFTIPPRHPHTREYTSTFRTNILK